jgi:hypothetical protein
MRDLLSKDGKIFIMDVDENEVPVGQESAFIQSIRSASGGGYEGSYADTSKLLNRGASLGATTGTWEAPSENTEATESTLTPGSWENAPEVEEPNKDTLLDKASGVAGGVVRDKGLTAGLTATGALAGSVIPGMGTAIGAGLGLVTGEVVVPALDFVTEAANKLFDKDFTTPTEAFTAMFDKMGIDEPETSGERVATAMTTGAMDSASILNIGNLLSEYGTKLGPSFIKNIGKVLAAAPAQEYAGSIGAEGAATGTQELINEHGQNLPDSLKATLPVAAGFAGAMAGGAATKGLATRQAAQGTPIPTDIQDAVETGQRYGQAPTGMDLTADLSDRTSSLRSRGAESRGGTAQFSKDFNRVRTNAVDSVGREYGVEINGLGSADNISEDIAQNFLNTHKSEVIKNAELKRNVIEDLTGKNVSEYTVDLDPEMGTTLTVARNSADATAPTTATANNQIVDVSKTVNLIQDETERLNRLNEHQFSTRVKRLAEWEDTFQDKDLAQLEDARKELSSLWKSQDSSIGDTEKAFIRKLYNSVNEDMGNFIKSEGTTAQYNQWQVANKNLSDLADKFQLSGIGDALKNGENNPTKVVNLLWNKEPKVIESFYNDLDSEGKQLAEKALMSKIIEGSQVQGKSSGSEFANRLADYEPSIKAVLGEAGLKRFEGMKKWLDTTAFHEMVATGRPIQRTPNINQVPGAGPVAAGVARANPVPALAASTAGTAIHGAWLKHYTKPEVRDLLVRMSYTKPGTTTSENIAKRLVETIRSLDSEDSGTATAEKYGMTTTGIPGVN